MGICSRPADMRRDKFLHLPGESFDNIVISRLKDLIATDKNMRERAKSALEQIYKQQGKDFVSIRDQLDGIKTQLVESAKKRMKTSSDDPMYEMLEVEREALMDKQKSLEAKKARLGIMDSPEEIELLHDLLGNFDAVWSKRDLTQRQRAFYPVGSGKKAEGKKETRRVYARRFHM